MQSSSGIFFVGIWFLLTSPAAAWVSYDLNCTGPAEADHVNFVSSSDVRSTMDIVWSSLSILLLCTWNAMHLSVPSHFDVQEKGWRGSIKWHWKAGKEKAIWMLVMLVSPEYLFGKGMMENFAARHSVKMFNEKEKWTMTHAYFANMRGFVLKFKVKSARHKGGLKPTPTGKGSQLGLEVTKFSKDDEVPYDEQNAARAEQIELIHCRENCHPKLATRKTSTTLQPDRRGNALITTHKGQHVEQASGASSTPVDDGLPKNLTEAFPETAAVVTISGHKILETSKSVTSQTVELGVPSEIASSHESLHSSAEATAVPEKSDVLPEHEEWEATWALNASQWYEAYHRGLIKNPPQVEVEAINDRSKGDGLAKGIAILQITWLVIQVIARAFEHLAITLLEVTVLAFATTAISIYITIWSKPQGVKVPIFVEADRLITREDVIHLAARSPKSSMVVHEFWLHGVCVRGMADNVFPYAPGVPIPFTKDKDGHYKHHISAVTLGIGLGGAIFGAVHCAAWNFAFPTPPEQIVWQVACVFIAASPMPFSFFYIFTQQRAKVGGKSEAWTRRLVLLPLLLMMPVYLLLRLYLMVEACRALAYPEASTFQDVQWPSFIPHLG